MKKYVLSFMCVAIIFSGCSNMSKTGKGTLIGSGAGAAIGAGLGAIIGKDAKGAAIGRSGRPDPLLPRGATIGNRPRNLRRLRHEWKSGRIPFHHFTSTPGLFARADSCQAAGRGRQKPCEVS